MSKNDKLFLIRIMVACLALIIAVSVVHILDKPNVEAWTYHAVAPGDTLWSIAEEYNPNYVGDIRYITYEIKMINGKQTSELFVGELLEVPVME